MADAKEGPSDGPGAKLVDASDGAKISDERPQVSGGNCRPRARAPKQRSHTLSRRSVAASARRRHDSAKADEPTESDWLFEYIDSVMKSPAWESEVMGFVDDNCMVFDNEEENKFEHSVVHNKFQEVRV